MATVAMDQELRALLTSFGLSAETVTWLEGLGCTSVFLYTTWSNDVSKVDELAAKSPKHDEPAEAPKSH